MAMNFPNRTLRYVTYFALVPFRMGEVVFLTLFKN